MDAKILFVVLGFFTFVALSQAGKFVNINDHRYYISHPLKKNWYEAQRYCIYHGMVLVDINTEDENNRILSIIKDPEYINDATPHFWTSGTDLGSEGQFYWASSGHSLIFTDFPDPGQPDNAGGNENCLEIRGEFGWKWNDHVCTEKKYFVCRDSVAYPFASSNCITRLGEH